MAIFVKIYNENPNPKEIQKVVDILRNGGVIIYPTDTVYAVIYHHKSCSTELYTKARSIKRLAEKIGHQRT